MLQTISQRTQTGASTGLRAGIASLTLGLAALLLSAGSAFAAPVEFSFTETLSSGDFTIVELVQSSGNTGDGIDEWSFGMFNLMGYDWANLTITEFKLSLTLDPTLTKYINVETDEVLFGSAFTGAALTDEMFVT